jgi:uncharacterized membrane protein
MTNKRRRGKKKSNFEIFITILTDRLGIKEKSKNLGFWTSMLTVAYFGLVAFGFEIAPAEFEMYVNTLIIVLNALGILSNPTQGKWYLDEPSKEVVDTLNGKRKSRH